MKTKINFRCFALFLTAAMGVVTIALERSHAQAASNPAPIVPPSVEALPGKGPAQPLPWFQNTWKSRRTIWADRHALDEGAVVFLGDSITQGWTTLTNDFPDLKVANRGISGDTTRGLLYRLQDDVLSLKPAAVVVLIGTNDLGLGAKPDEVAENIRALVIAMKKADPKMPVVICNIMPSSARMNRPAAKIKSFNATLDLVMKDSPQVIRCDTWSIFANENGDAKKEEFPDLLHPNARGYAKWTAALQPILSKLDLKTAKKNKSA